MPLAAYMRNKPLAWRQVGGGIVIVNTRRGEVTELAGMAAWLWSRIGDGALTAAQIERDLCEGFDVSAAEATADVTSALESLISLELLVYAP